MAFFKKYYVNTTENVDLLPVTSDVRYAVRDSQAKDGLVTIMVPGPGASPLIFEPMSEVIEELKIAFELFAGEGGVSTDKRKEKVAVAPRVQSAVIGRSLCIPLVNGQLLMDPYEEIYIADFDKNAKRREFVVQVMPSEPAAPQQAQGRPAPQKKR
jgi:secondary thiamine-phosphate synthase enzyme